jgi:hypothetical protein
MAYPLLKVLELMQLSLAECFIHLTKTEAAGKPVSRMIFSGMGLDDEDLKIIVSYLARNPEQFAYLDFSNNNLTNDCLESLMSLNKGIGQIYLGKNKIDAEEDVLKGMLPNATLEANPVEKSNFDLEDEVRLSQKISDHVSVILQMMAGSQDSASQSQLSSKIKNDLGINNSVEQGALLSAAAVLQSLKEIDQSEFDNTIQSINGNGYYDSKVIDFVVRTDLHDRADIKYFSAEESHQLGKCFDEFKDGSQTTLLMPLFIPLSKASTEPNHFVALHIQKLENGQQHITYIDPSGLDSIPDNVVQTIKEKFGVEESAIVKTTNMIQNRFGGMLTNHGCGPLTANILCQLARGNYVINANQKQLMRKTVAGLVPIDDYSYQESKLADQELRAFHKSLLAQVELAGESHKRRAEARGDEFRPSKKPKIDEEKLTGLLAKVENSGAILDLSQQQINDDELKFIAEKLKDKKNIVQLKLSGNSITNSGLRHLADILPTTSIQNLNLSANPIVLTNVDEGLEKLAGALIDSKCSVQRITVDGDKVGNFGKIIKMRGGDVVGAISLLESSARIDKSAPKSSTQVRDDKKILPKPLGQSEGKAPN